MAQVNNLGVLQLHVRWLGSGPVAAIVQTCASRICRPRGLDRRVEVLLSAFVWFGHARHEIRPAVAGRIRVPNLSDSDLSSLASLSSPLRAHLIFVAKTWYLRS